MAVFNAVFAHDKGDVEVTLSNTAHCIPGAIFEDLDIDHRIPLVILLQQFREKACSQRRMQADAQSSIMAMTRHPRCGDGMVQTIDCDRNFAEEGLPCLSEVDAAMSALEKDNPKVVLEQLDARADG
ncbi:hypothetical protein LMIY3S_00049 [Labrys miyagiensis]